MIISLHAFIGFAIVNTPFLVDPYGISPKCAAKMLIYPPGN
jgi:hypothetical protein